MFFFINFLYSRGFSKKRFSITMFFISIYSLFFSGWCGPRYFRLGSLNRIIIFVVLVIFFFCLNLSPKKQMSLFILIPLRVIFFVSQNLVMFCLVFEWTLFPLVLSIFWIGRQPERSQGLYYFLFFSVFSSYPLIIFISSQITPSFLILYSNGSMIGLSFLIPFLVKLPIFFFHSWLPKAHVEAPTIGSIILAGLILKFGVWGIFRLRFFVGSIKEILEIIFLFGIILGSVSASTQSDRKRLVAFSSVCHINFLGFALISDSIQGRSASILIILTHGISSSIIFWVVGGAYFKTGRRQLSYISNYITLSFRSLLILRIVIFSNFSVPPTLGFWGEVVFLRIFFGTEIFFFFYSVLYLILVCYFSIFLYLRLSQLNIRTKIECREETFFISGLIIIFFFPCIIIFF